MLNSTTLEVAIGMALVYLLLSFFCTSINEAVAGLLGLRSRNLEAGVRSLLSEGKLTVTRKGSPVQVSLTELLYNHGLVQSLYKSGASEGISDWYNDEKHKATDWWRRGKVLPSYIPSRVFASAMFDLIFPGVGGSAEQAREQAVKDASDALAAAATAGVQVAGHDRAAELTRRVSAAVKQAQQEHMLEALAKVEGSAVKDALTALVRQAEGDLLRTRAALESWYDDAMDRVSGWYKHRTQLFLFALGLGVAVVVNVDSIAVGRALWNTPAVRSYAIKAAESYAQPNGSVDQAEAENSVKELESLTIPIGWSSPLCSTPNWARSPLQSMLGWLLTSFAIMLGAPFWFDLLNRFMVVRSTVKPAEKSGTEGSKDPATAA